MKFSLHKPDKWVIIKIKSPKGDFYKVLAGWSGGYLKGDSWRANSGITKVTIDGDYFLFEGHSGSIYKCHKNMYGALPIMVHVIRQAGDAIEILDEDTDFSLIDFHLP